MCSFTPDNNFDFLQRVYSIFSSAYIIALQLNPALIPGTAPCQEYKFQT